MLASHFNEFAILLTLAVIIGAIGIKLRQPLILSFIIVGMVAGPDGLGWITAQSDIDILASFGVTLLLFIVGLKLDLHEVRLFGSVVMVVGLCQIGLTTLAGWLLGLALGLDSPRALFIALALAFSSTIIIVKSLSDRYEIDSVFGRLTVGVLIVQDLVVVIAIIVLSSLNNHVASYPSFTLAISELLLKAAGFLAVIGLLARYIFPRVLRELAASRELLILFALSWAVILAVTTETLGFGKEIGGFVAGVSLASTYYRDVIASRLETVRNLLLLFFFLNLGARLELSAMFAEWPLALAFSLFVLFGKSAIVMLLLCYKRFRKRTAFMSGVALGQISEFSLIVAALGASLGYINTHDQGMITFIGVITIGVSTYLMAYASHLYQWLCPYLGVFERRLARHEDAFMTKQGDSSVDVIIFGYGRHGEYMTKLLRTFGLKILCVDFDPRRIRATGDPGVLLRYGDAEDVEFSKTLPLDRAKWVVSTIPHHDANHAIVSSLREARYQGKIALSAYHAHDHDDMEKMRVDMIFVPYQDAASSAVQRLVASLRGTG